MKRTAQSGWSLLEVLAYTAMLAVLINLGASLFVSAMRLDDIGTQTLDRMRAIEEVREDFTKTVRMAQGVSTGFGEFVSDEERLVLQLPTPSGSDTPHRYAIFGSEPGGNRLVRYEMTTNAEGGYALDAKETYPVGFESLRFEYGDKGPAEARFVTLACRAKGKDERVGTEYVFRATPRCMRATEGGAK